MSASQYVRVELGVDSVVPYLLRRKLLDASLVVDARGERVHVRDYTRRNRNFKVILPAQGLHVKQAMDPRAAEYRDGIRREAGVLREIARSPGLRILRAWTPRHHADDARSGVLVTGLLHPATTFLRYHENAGSPRASLDAANVAARILAVVHRAPTRALRGLPRDPPPLSGIPPALRRAARHDPRAVALVQALERPGIRRAATRLRKEWRRHHALVHTDPRFENFLLTHGAGPRGAPLNARLVDWELARIGDPAWDVAYYLTEHLRAPLVMRLDVGFFRDEARAFWSAYLARVRATRAERASMRARVLAMVPFTLAVVAYEALPVAPARPEVFETALGMVLDPRPHEWFASLEADA